MSWIYLPKNKSQYHNAKQGLHGFKLRWKVRILRRQSYWSLFYTMWLFAFLSFACRMGMISFGMFGGKYETTLRVNLPKTKNSSSIKNKDKRINIWLNKFGNLVIDDISIKNYYELSDYLKHQYSIHPHFIPVLVVDKDCHVKIVENLIRVLRECGFKKIIFKTYSPGILVS